MLLARRSQHGVFTRRPEALTKDLFVNLLDMSTTWKATSQDEAMFEGRDRVTGELSTPFHKYGDAPRASMRHARKARD